MKKFAVFTFFAFFVLISASAKKDEPKKDTYDYDNLVTSVRGVRSTPDSPVFCRRKKATQIIKARVLIFRK